MSTTAGVQTIGKVAVQTAAGKTERLYFIDHLRAALVILVVLHHVALVYGSSVEGFYYLEPPFTNPLAFLALLLFALINQAWFMGAFFLLAGYFTPGSFDHKGSGAFLKDRLVRLGIPLLVFYFVLNPLSRVGWWLMPSSLTGITTPLTWKVYPGLLGIGPLWFVAMLLVFSFGYAGWRWLTGKRSPAPASQASTPGYLLTGVFILALAGTSYLVRMVIPIGKSVAEFPTLAYFPQYLSFFVIGAVASRHDWFKTLPRSMGTIGFIAAIASLIFLFQLAFSSQWFSLALSDALGNAWGNGTWQSAVYALWDSIFAVGLCLALIPLFRRQFNGRSALGRVLSQNGYAVYIIHIPILVYLAYTLRNVQIGGLLKFGLASLIAVPVCFAVAYLLRRIPGVSQVI